MGESSWDKVLCTWSAHPHGAQPGSQGKPPQEKEEKKNCTALLIIFQTLMDQNHI